MLSKSFIQLLTLASVNGIEIADTQLEDTTKLAEVSQEESALELETTETSTIVSLEDFSNLQERVEQICQEWVEFQEWSLFNICDDNAPGSKNLRDGRSIDELKKQAETDLLDGFTIITDNPDWSNAVYFKSCGLPNSEALVDALTEFEGHTTYLRLDVPC